MRSAASHPAPAAERRRGRRWLDGAWPAPASLVAGLASAALLAGCSGSGGPTGPAASHSPGPAVLRPALGPSGWSTGKGPVVGIVQVGGQGGSFVAIGGAGGGIVVGPGLGDAARALHQSSEGLPAGVLNTTLPMTSPYPRTLRHQDEKTQSVTATMAFDTRIPG